MSPTPLGYWTRVQGVKFYCMKCNLCFLIHIFYLKAQSLSIVNLTLVLNLVNKDVKLMKDQIKNLENELKGIFKIKLYRSKWSYKIQNFRKI